MSDKYYADSATSSRKESPAIEHAVQDECARIFKELFEAKGLYQNLRVDDAIFAKMSADFVAEFKKRPIVPCSRDERASPQRMVGCMQSVDTTVDERNAAFYLPNVSVGCSRCARITTFSSTASNRGTFGPYPIASEEAEQVYSLCYMCGECRNSYIVFQVLRKGLKFQLTGRSVPFRPAIEKEWPKEIQEIVKDALAAAVQNDVPAAYYHLRTAAEFYLKKECGLEENTKVEGSDLCERYNATVDERLKSTIPSLGILYSELSAGLHSRKVTPEVFKKQYADFLLHLKAKDLFAQLNAR